jgi:hypothetical protein
MAREAGVELRETLVPAKDPVGLETATAEAIRSLEGGVVGFREGDDRDVTEHAGEIGRLPLPRNDGVESVSALRPAREAARPRRAGSGRCEIAADHRRRMRPRRGASRVDP